MTEAHVSTWKDESVRALSEVAAKFLAAEVVPRRETWETQHFVDRDVWVKAGEKGLLCCSIPEEYGGGGGTVAHDLAVAEKQYRMGETSWGNMVHSGVVAPYILHYGTEDQKKRWLPKLASGAMIGAIAMTEPGTGSDLQGVRTTAVLDGDHYVVNGAKTFISNGSMADLILVVAKTTPGSGAKGISLVVVETADSPGFVRGRILEKVGQLGADTSELAFNDVRVPKENLLGGVEGRGFLQLMGQLPQERLFVAIAGVAVMEAAVEETLAYVKQRPAFGKTIWDFQNTRFTLAECSTSTRVARTFVDACVDLHLRGALDTTVAAMAKWWVTEQQVDVVDRCLQLHGGYGYMREYPIARMYQDSRVQKIYGGANEVMMEIVARSL